MGSEGVVWEVGHVECLRGSQQIKRLFSKRVSIKYGRAYSVQYGLWQPVLGVL